MFILKASEKRDVLMKNNEITFEIMLHYEGYNTCQRLVTKQVLETFDARLAYSRVSAQPKDCVSNEF